MIPIIRDLHPHIWEALDPHRVEGRRGHRHAGSMTTALYPFQAGMYRFKGGGGIGGIIKSVVIGAALGALTGGIGAAMFGGSAFTAFGVEFAADSILGGVVKGAALGAIGGLLSGAAGMLMGAAKPDEAQQQAYQQRENKLTIRSSTAPRKIILGTALAGGVLVYATSTGATREYFHSVNTVASHQVKALRECTFNNNPESLPRFSGKYRINKHLGTQTQAADSDLVAEAGGEWTASHRGRGIAYIAPRIQYDTNAWVTGLPSISVMTDGALVYDPRAAHLTISTSTTASPGVFTTVGAHGFAAGDVVFLRDHAGATYASTSGYAAPVAKAYTVNTVPTSSTFTLLDDSGEPMTLLSSGSGGSVAKCGWSSNWALGLLHYLLARDGINCPTNRIDWTYFETAANVSDEDVSLGNATTFTASDASNVLTLAADVGWQTGVEVHLSSTGTLPAPLSASAPYYWIRHDGSDPGIGQLASSYAAAIAGTAIDITDAGTGTHTVTLATNFSARADTDTIYLYSRSDSGKDLWHDDAYMALNPDVLGASEGGTGTGWWGDGSVGNFTPAISAPRGYDHYKSAGESEGRQGTWTSATYIETGDAVTVAGSLPGGLSSSTTYYWLNTGRGAGKLATSRANAMAGNAVDLTTVGSGTITRVSQARYTVNGILDLSKKPIDVLNELLTAGSGVLVYASGKYRLFAGAPAASVKTLGEDGLRDTFRLLPRAGRQQTVNAVRGTYKEPGKYWEMTDFPPLTRATYETEDGGQRLYRDVALPLTIDPQRAQRIANIALGRGRRSMTVTYPGTVELLGISAWDAVQLALPTPGLASTKFRVNRWVLAEDGQGIDLELIQEDDAIYTWSAGQGIVVPKADLSSLPSPWEVATPTALVLTSGTADVLRSGGTAQQRIKVAFTAPADSFATTVEVRYRTASESEWTTGTGTLASEPAVYINGVSQGTEYVVQLRAKNTLGAISDWVEDTHTTDALVPTSPGAPVVVESLYETRNGAGVRAKVAASWAASSDPLLALYQFEYSSDGGASYRVLPRLAETETEILDLAPGEYRWRVAALNALGVSSAYSPVTVATVYGLAGEPSALTGMTLSAVSSLALLRWDRATDLDVLIGGKVEFRHASSTSAGWTESTSIAAPAAGQDTLALLPLKPGRYFARFVDSSDTPGPVSYVDTDGATVLAFANVATVAEAPTFPGAHSSTQVASAALELAGAYASVDDIPDWDAVADLSLPGGVASSGVYTFATTMDLTTVQRVRLRSELETLVVAVLDQVDSRSGNLDDWQDFDGTAAASADAYVEASATNDDPAGSPTWGAWQRLDVAEFNARAFRFRAKLGSGDPAYNIKISTLSVHAEQL